MDQSKQNEPPAKKQKQGGKSSDKGKPAFVTPEFIAEQRAKKQAKLAQKAEKRKELGLPDPATDLTQQGIIPEKEYIHREIVTLNAAEKGDSFRLMTYNILAQALIRRELFPHSDGPILRQKNRVPILQHEILSLYKPDVLCMQEVDLFEENWKVALEKAGYEAIHRCGRSKRHGCVIAWKRDHFDCVDDAIVIHYDDHGVPFKKTGNIALIVRLRHKGNQKGLVLSTTHLFWHPKAYYERARQGSILLKEASRLQAELGAGWRLILAGDFNAQPNEPLYHLLTQERPLAKFLPPEQIETMEVSMKMTAHVREGEADDEISVENEDAAATASTCSSPELLPVRHIVEEFNSYLRCYSVYGGHYHRIDAGNTYEDGSHSQSHGKVAAPPACEPGQEPPTAVNRYIGRNEPRFTNYTGMWSLMLDYIFIVGEQDAQVKSLLQMPREEQLSPGLPAMGRFPSDHLCLMAEIVNIKVDSKAS